MIAIPPPPIHFLGIPRLGVLSNAAHDLRFAPMANTGDGARAPKADPVSNALAIVAIGVLQLGVAISLPTDPARTFRHAITHRRITVHVHETTIDAEGVAEDRPGLAWVRQVDLRDFGVSSMTRKALA